MYRENNAICFTRFSENDLLRFTKIFVNEIRDKLQCIGIEEYEYNQDNNTFCKVCKLHRRRIYLFNMPLRRS